MRFVFLLVLLGSSFLVASARTGFAGAVPLTSEERLWLAQNHSRLVLAIETGYPPFVFLDPKQHTSGLANDYLLAVEAKLGLKFRREQFSSLDAILAKARRGEVHIVNAVTRTPGRERFLSFTRPFISVPNVILVRKERTETLGEKDLARLKVSLVKSYAVTEHLNEAVQGIQVNLVPDDLSAILDVSFGRSDAAVIDLATASYLISEKGITNLRVAGETSTPIHLAMAVPNSAAPLKGILQKGLDAMTAAERETIRKRWIDATARTIPRSFWIWSGAILLAVLGGMTAVLVWNRTLRRLVAVRTADLAREKEALQQSENYHRSILQTAMDGIWLADERGRLLEVNYAYCRMSGYCERELLAMRVADLETMDPERMQQRLAKVMETGQDSFESRHRRKDGSVFDVEVRVQGLGRGDGGMVAVVRDITERKRIEYELRMTRVSVEAASDAIFWITPDARFVDVNPAACRSLGYTREELLRLGVGDVDPHQEEASWALQFPELRRVGTIRFESEHRARDGRTFSVEITANYVRFGDEERNCAFVRDISDRKEAQEKRIILEQQLQQSHKLESIGRLAGGVAHDFNNMLGVILGHAELGMMRCRFGDPVLDDLRGIKQAAERSAELTRQLLAFARKQMVEPKVLDLNHTVAQLLKMLQRLMGEEISLTWQPASNLWQVKVDPTQVDQMVANLCVNARDAIVRKGTITLRTQNRIVDASLCAGNADAIPGEYVCLMISDDGAGMDAETVSRIFEPFFTTKEVGKGTGLGLATVYGAMRQNDGFIDIESQPGEGTTFYLYLPRHLAEEEMRRGRDGDASELLPRGEETILLVEDEEGILRISTDMLAIQGYRVLPARSAAEAERLARDHGDEIHLVITDVIMPGSNGNELARELERIRPGMKRLFMSGYSADTIARHGVLDDGIQFIQKPFTLPTLAEKVREVLDEEHPSPLP